MIFVRIEINLINVINRSEAQPLSFVSGLRHPQHRTIYIYYELFRHFDRVECKKIFFVHVYNIIVVQVEIDRTTFGRTDAPRPPVPPRIVGFATCRASMAHTTRRNYYLSRQLVIFNSRL